MGLEIIEKLYYYKNNACVIYRKCSTILSREKRKFVERGRKPRKTIVKIFIKLKRKGKMNNKLILTSLLAMAVVSPAVGVSFTEIMETNKTYENAATKQNMGVDAGTVTAEAYYTIYPGYYLPANSYTPAVCPAGSYCEGLEQITKSTTAKGLTSCQSTNTYTQSSKIVHRKQSTRKLPGEQRTLRITSTN